MPPPYRGPAPYEPEDRAFFFGRDRLVAELVALVTERRFAILSGASGSGKSPCCGRDWSRRCRRRRDGFGLPPWSGCSRRGRVPRPPTTAC
ncbi:hypothetical protein [Streptomyces europaeiscabiei]|uniref:nSTAND1 domain-containing NTPase n=1 Tax=Streptomyces europaeiscabiei TaxID=146819 RepID=UPI002E18C6C5